MFTATPTTALKLTTAFVFALLMGVTESHAAYISEIDQGGPAGTAIELSNVDPSSAYTLVFMNATPYSSASFGWVLDVLHLPAGSGRGGVAMVSDSTWPGDPALTIPRPTLPTEPSDATLQLWPSRLLLVMTGQVDVRVFDQPLTLTDSADRFDKSLVTDYLVLNSGDPTALYQSPSYNLDHINGTLGIDLLGRLIDTNAGRVIARARHPDQDPNLPLDMDTFFAGDPDSTMKFEAETDLYYIYTPGLSNTPLQTPVPEPGSLALLGATLCLSLRRRRGAAASTN